MLNNFSLTASCSTAFSEIPLLLLTYLLNGATVLVELWPPHIFYVRIHDSKFLQGGVISPTPNLEACSYYFR
jgi:hypothetical protein